MSIWLVVWLAAILIGFVSPIVIRTKWDSYIKSRTRKPFLSHKEQRVLELKCDIGWDDDDLEDFMSDACLDGNHRPSGCINRDEFCACACHRPGWTGPQADPAYADYIPEVEPEKKYNPGGIVPHRAGMIVGPKESTDDVFAEAIKGLNNMMAGMMTAHSEIVSKWKYRIEDDPYDYRVGSTPQGTPMSICLFPGCFIIFTNKNESSAEDVVKMHLKGSHGVTSPIRSYPKGKS